MRCEGEGGSYREERMECLGLGTLSIHIRISSIQVVAHRAKRVVWDA